MRGAAREPVDDERHDHDDDERHERVAGEGDIVRDPLPLVSDPVADRRETARVDDRPEEVEDLEPSQRHVRRARDDCRERPHDRHRASDQHSDFALAREPALRAIEVLRGKQDVSTESIDERPATDAPDGVGGGRPGELRGHPHDEDEGEIQPARSGEHAGESERDLGGDRHAAGLGEGKQDERDVARFSEEVLHRPICSRSRRPRRSLGVVGDHRR